LTLSDLWLLELAKEGTNISSFLSSAREKAVYNGMVRKMLITDDGRITKLGEEYLDILNTPVQEEVKAEVRQDSGFDVWWETYPSTDYFEYKGRTFQGTQKKHLKKGECKTLFDRMVSLKLFTETQIIGATQFHIEMAKQMSLKRGINQLSFIPNSERYLREKVFEPFIKQYEKKKPTEEQNFTVDI
jgi:hypothetical protein